MACLGPSEELLKHGPENWREWSRRYHAEMLGETTCERQNPIIRNAGQKFTLRLIKHLAMHQNVTLLCHCGVDAVECHRFLLQKLIRSGKLTTKRHPKPNDMIIYHNQLDAGTQFQDWCGRNPNGFYLNRKSNGKFMLHHSDCDHAGVLSPESSPTTNPKYCSLDRAELESWVFERGAQVAFCSDCL